MSGRIKRDAGGQFAPGQSGNPDGARRRRPRELPTLTDLYRIHLEVAGEIIGTKDGKPVTRYENALRSLAKGDSANRLAAKGFLEECRRATYHFEMLARQEAARRPRP